MEAPNARPMVSLRAVDKHFGELHVLKSIDLDVAPREVVVVVGPSGSGKSTLCRSINRLETIDGGDCEVQARAVAERGVAVHRNAEAYTSLRARANWRGFAPMLAPCPRSTIRKQGRARPGPRPSWR